MSYKNCPNCEKKMDGLLTSRHILSESTTTIINSFHSPKSEAYCNSCGINIIAEKKVLVDSAKASLMSEIETLIGAIPIITIQQPIKWDYRILGLISAQSISGTGFLSELSGSWADFTGGQSSTLANKVSSGEDICKKKLRLTCALHGGNAIVGTDIDYSEVGGGKGMLMVCMAGTAVNVKLNNEDFDSKTERLELLASKVKELNALPNLNHSEYYS